MAVGASHPLHLSSDELLAHFDLVCPQPTPWKVCTPPSEMHLAVTLALHSTQFEPQLWTREPMKQTSIGHAGWNSVMTTLWILGLLKGMTPHRTSKCLHNDAAMDVLHQVVSLHDLAQLRTPFEVSARAVDSWGASDIRLNQHGAINFWLSRQCCFHQKEDPLSQCTKLIPIQVVKAIVEAALHLRDVGFNTVADVTCLTLLVVPLGQCA